MKFLDALRDARPGGTGIRDWSIYMTEARRLSLGIKDEQTGNAHAPLTVSESCGARYLIVWDDGRVSRGYLERRQIEIDAAGALAQARAASYDDPDAAQVLGPAPMPEVELHHESAARWSSGDTSEIAERLRRIRRKVGARGVRTWSGSASASEARSRLITSAGLEAQGHGTSIGWYVYVNGEIGDGHSSRGPDTLEAFEARLDRLLDRAEALDRPTEALAPGVHPVILHPRVVEEYALDTLLHNLGGSAVEHGDGSFRLDQFGSEQAVLREDLSLRLDPLQPLRNGSYRFTMAGLPAARCSFIEAGRLIQPILDLKYARRLGLPPTSIPYASDALYLEAGEALPLDRALERADGGALVLSVLGVHTQDSASGDFSLSAPQILRIGSGGFPGRMRGTISGNLFDVLRHDELQLVRFEGEHTPGMLFPCRLDPK